MDKTERIARLLSKGIKPGIVSKMVGCSPSYVSNLIADEDFRLVVSDLQAEDSESKSTEAEETAVLKDRYSALEHRVLDALEDKIAFFGDRELIALMDRIGARREKLAPPVALTTEIAHLDSHGNPTKLVRISVPSICAPELTIGSNNEIIAIGSRSVSPMATTQIRELLEAHTTSKENDHDLQTEALDWS